MSGLALQMKYRLGELAKAHRVTLPTAYTTESLLPICDDDRVILSGYASTFDVDAERMRFAPNALRWFSWAMPPLLLRHRPGAIGTVDRLEFSSCGLRCSVSTDHELGKLMPAFSIGATIQAYVLRDADTPQFYADVLVATLDEVSLTDRPCLASALVNQRMPALPYLPSHAALVEKLARVRQMVQQLEFA